MSITITISWNLWRAKGARIHGKSVKENKDTVFASYYSTLPNKIITCQLFSAENTSASLLSSCSDGVQVYLYVVNCSQIIPLVFLSLWPSGGNFWWLYVIEVVSGMLSGYNRLLLPVQEPSEWFTSCALPDAIRPTLMAVRRSEGKTHPNKMQLSCLSFPGSFEVHEHSWSREGEGIALRYLRERKNINRRKTSFLSERLLVERKG